MAIKILGGSAQGLELISPVSELTRPTSVMLKRRFFDSYQNLSGSIFVDLCAGCGQVGLEALSRGALEVYLVDKTSSSYINCKNNIKRFEKFTELGSAITDKSDVVKWLKLFLSKRAHLAEDVIIFCDPPYQLLKIYEEVYRLIEESEFAGLFVFEACSQKTMPMNDFDKKFPGSFKMFKQGTSFFKLYHFNKESPEVE